MPALHFLRTCTYAHLDPTLWDSHLWLYGDLERGLGQFAGWRDQGRLFVHEADAAVGGIALLTGSTVLLDTRSPDVPVTSWLSDIVKKRNDGVSVEAGHQHVADAIAEIPGAVLTGTHVRLFTCAPAAPVHPAGEELFAGRGYRFWRNWESLDALLGVGYRVFGLRGDDGQMLANAGLWPLSVRRSDLVMVGTDPRHFRKGYASAVAALALKSGVDCARMVTWGTELSNEASIGVARKLGFRELVAVRHLTVAAQ